VSKKVPGCASCSVFRRVSERLLLDEMWSPEIAVQLCRRGHDVIAVAEHEA
jgi:hypothetical protein